MNQLAPIIASRAPALVAAAGAGAAYRFLEFFTAQIRNPHTRRAYARTAGEFFGWLAEHGVKQLTAIESAHVATYIEELTRERSAPTAKLRLAALRRLFDWMVIGEIMPTNPAAAVRGPRHIVRRGKTPVLDPAEARRLPSTRSTRRPSSRFARPRADRLDGLFLCAHRRGVDMRVEDVVQRNRRPWVRLHGKGGKQHAMPCHHNLEATSPRTSVERGCAERPRQLLFQAPTAGRPGSSPAIPCPRPTPMR